MPYILESNSLVVKCTTYISSESAACLFIFFTWSFAEQKFNILMKSNFSNFSFYGLYAFSVKSKNSLLSPRSQRISI